MGEGEEERGCRPQVEGHSGDTHWLLVPAWGTQEDTKEMRRRAPLLL